MLHHKISINSEVALHSKVKFYKIIIVKILLFMFLMRGWEYYLKQELNIRKTIE